LYSIGFLSSFVLNKKLLYSTLISKAPFERPIYLLLRESLLNIRKVRTENNKKERDREVQIE